MALTTIVACLSQKMYLDTNLFQELTEQLKNSESKTAALQSKLVEVEKERDEVCSLPIYKMNGVQ